MKHLIGVLTLFFVLAAIAACAPAAAPQPTSAPPPAASAQPTAAPSKKLVMAMVTDEAGLGDQGFNDSAWEGMNRAKKDFGADIKVVESREQAQYVPNFSTLAEAKTDLIVGVGFLLNQAVNEVAVQY
ncbi:MAG: BMP family ABC transporter substrate-binding protein, partial [Chloroflexi bacterium]|nr:BMP family ABC transporter substrate-binding protein [Chloroflexota bacterium]